MATVEERIPDTGDGASGPTALTIRPATVDDVEVVAAIEAESFANPWQPQTFRSLIARGRAHILVAEHPGEGVVGYTVLWWAMDQGELANIAVREGHQGRGIGSALLDRVLAQAREAGVESLFLEVRMSNEKAHQLYLSRGFTQVAVRKDYYRNPREDARILVRRLVDGDR